MIINVIEYLKNSAAIRANKVAFDDFSKSVTFGELYDLTKKLASGLLPYSGKPIAIYMDKSVDCLIAMYGVIMSGGFYTIIDTKMPTDRIKKIIEQFEPAAIITLPKNNEK